MPIIGAIVVLIQFCFAFHVLKTGRAYWWIFIIMGFPVMGCVIYYFVEVFPGSREQRRANKAARTLARVLQPDAELRKRAEELEICGSVDNKIALAAECMNHQMYAEAAKLYESCLQGAFASDGAVLFGLARAAVEGREWDKASTALARLKAAAPRTRPLEVRLLEARVLEGRGQTDAALEAFRTLIPVFVGLEARFRYGDLLLRLGKNEAAMDMFNEVMKHAKRFASSVEDEERWASAARQAIGSS
ncbi:MAG TPA: tetratricopeptide repeat protein [Burkholderiales bacterium]|nr:tetratricopeptide repeat protein [Burkholderiales bacterium]